jgi:hypothetical protein
MPWRKKIDFKLSSKKKNRYFDEINDKNNRITCKKPGPLQVLSP